jgi:hypothetical protein
MRFCLQTAGKEETLRVRLIRRHAARGIRPNVRRRHVGAGDHSAADVARFPSDRSEGLFQRRLGEQQHASKREPHFIAVRSYHALLLEIAYPRVGSGKLSELKSSHQLHDTFAGRG